MLASPDIMGLSQAMTPGRGFTELVSLVAESILHGWGVRALLPGNIFGADI